MVCQGIGSSRLFEYIYTRGLSPTSFGRRLPDKKQHCWSLRQDCGSCLWRRNILLLLHCTKTIRTHISILILWYFCTCHVLVFCTNFVGIRWYICQKYWHENCEHIAICISFWYWRIQNETKSEGFPWTMHSGIHAFDLGTIFGMANYFGDGSHFQQDNVLQDRVNDM